MKKIQHYLFAIASICIFLSVISCNHAIYTPIDEVVDPAYKKGDINFSFNTLNSNFIKPQLSLSYSPVDKYTINYSTVLLNDYKTHSFSIGRYFNKFNSNQKITPFIDVYIGATIGNSREISNSYDNSYNFIEQQIKAKFNRYFLQSSYTFTKSISELRFTARMSYIDWQKVNVISENPIVPNIAEDIANNDLNLYPEIGFKYTVKGSEFFKIYSGCNMRIASPTNDLGFEKFNMTVGLTINANDLFSEIKRRKEIKKEFIEE